MSDLAPGWEWATLEDIAKWRSGGTPKAGAQEYYGGPIPWAVIGDLNDSIVRDTANTITQRGLDNSSAKLVPAGTILIAMYGSIGKLGISAIEMATNQAIALAQPEEIEPRYIFWYLMSQRSQLNQAGKGATQRNISQTILRKWPIPVAPLAEQRRIVTALEDHLSHLDAGARALRMAGARVRKMTTAWLSQMLTPWASQLRPIGELLREKPINGRSVPTREGGFPVLRLTALKDGRIDLSERKAGAWSFDQAAPFLVQEGDFLVSRGNGSLPLVGRGGLVAAAPDLVAFPDTLIRLRPDTDVLDPPYLAIVWNSGLVRRQIESRARTTAGIYKINQAILSEITIPVPPIGEQRWIAQNVDDLAHQTGRLANAVQAATKQERQLRRSLLTDAFAGHLLPQNPNDEPASILLNRIRAERIAPRAHRLRITGQNVQESLL